MSTREAMIRNYGNFCIFFIYLSIFPYWPRSYLSIRPGSANFEILIKNNFWLNFCLNKECPKLLCGLGIGHRRRQTTPVWNSSGGKDFFRASLYVWRLRY